MTNEQRSRMVELLKVGRRPSLARIDKLGCVIVVTCFLPVIAWLLFATGQHWLEYRYTNNERASTRRQFHDIWNGIRGANRSGLHLPFPNFRETRENDVTEFVPSTNGAAVYSWRAAIPQFVAGFKDPWDLTQPMDAPINQALTAASFAYTYDANRSPRAGDGRFPDTNVVAVTGPGTAWGDGAERPMPLQEVSPNAILAVETRSSGIPWPAPGDFDVRSMPRSINAPDGKGISSRYAGGFHVLFADGNVWFISDDVPFDTLDKFFTTERARTLDREKVLGPYVIDRGKR